MVNSEKKRDTHQIPSTDLHKVMTLQRFPELHAVLFVALYRMT